MKEILNRINTLQGFMSNEEFTSSVNLAIDREYIPPICEEYGGPYDPGEPDEPIER